MFEFQDGSTKNMKKIIGVLIMVTVISLLNAYENVLNMCFDAILIIPQLNSNSFIAVNTAIQ